MWVLPIGRFLFVTCQQRNNTILKPKPGREKSFIPFLVLIFSRASLWYTSFPPIFYSLIFSKVHCKSSPIQQDQKTPAFYQHIYFLGNDDSLWAITCIIQGLGFHSYSQLRAIYGSTFAHKNEI